MSAAARPPEGLPRVEQDGVLRDVPSPAKLNLFLHVTGRRDDGYHLLQTVFRLIDLSDTLHFTRRDDGRIARLTELPGVPQAQCLTVRAAQALQRATGTRFGVDIELDKRIPAGGGLGGGSSNAATVLLALNRLWGTGLSRAELLGLALPLGADVPVFVFGENAFAEGIGEALQPVALPPRWYVVVQPNAHVPTAAVFSDPQLTRDTKPIKITDFPRDALAFGREEEKMVQAGSPGGLGGFGRNDLESVVMSRFPVVALARQLATQAVYRVCGGSEREVRMTGSGACLFIECVSGREAVAIEAEIAATIRAADAAAADAAPNAIRSVTVCAGLDRHPLQHWAA